MGYITPTLERKTETEVFKSVVRLTEKTLWNELTFKWFTDGVEEKKFEWWGDWGAARKFIGSRKIDSPPQHDATFDSDTYEKTTAWNRLKMKDKLLWSFAEKKVMELPQIWVELPEVMLIEKLTSTTDTMTLDGVTFFSDYHPIDLRPGVYNSNKISGTGVTAANIIADFGSFKILLHSLQRRDGRTIYRNSKRLKYKIVHSADLDDVMTHVFKSPRTGLSETQGRYSGEDVELEISGDLVGNDWYIFVMNVPIKPFMYMEVVKPIWEYDETKAFSDNEIRYGVVGRHKIHYAYWQCAFKVEQ